MTLDLVILSGIRWNEESLFSNPPRPSADGHPTRSKGGEGVGQINLLVFSTMPGQRENNPMHRKQQTTQSHRLNRLNQNSIPAVSRQAQKHTPQ